MNLAVLHEVQDEPFEFLRRLEQATEVANGLTVETVRHLHHVVVPLDVAIQRATDRCDPHARTTKPHRNRAAD